MARKHANPPIIEDVTSQINEVLKSLHQNQVVIPQLRNNHGVGALYATG